MTSARHAFALLWVSVLAFTGNARAQQDAADRFWLNLEQQQNQRQNQPPSMPAGLGDHAAAQPASPALGAFALSADERQQQHLLGVLNAVNRRDWFGADRLARQYAQTLRGDPSLITFVEASRQAARGEHDAALAGYRDVLRANPQFVRVTLDLARTLYADQRLHDAEAAFRQLRLQPLPPDVVRYIDDHLLAIGQRSEALWSVSLSAVHEDNVNGASTFVDPCALVFLDTCLTNEPGRQIADNGVYLEAGVSKLWPLAGHHGLLLRSLNHGNHYFHQNGYDSLVSTTYLGYQYASARWQVQALPLFEYDHEGGHEIYRAFGMRAGAARPLDDRALLEANVEYKARRFASRFVDNLQGDTWSTTLSGQYALQPGWLAYGNLIWRDSNARQPVFAYQEKVARLGLYRSFSNRVTANAAYGWRQKRADAVNALFGKRQRDIERDVYLNVTLPAYRWQGLTPTLSYEYRDNRSSIPHAYNFEKSRLTVGFNAVF